VIEKTAQQTGQQTSTEHTDRLTDHWWPRPGWRPGRTVLTWHLTYAGASELHRLVAGYQEALRGLPAMRPHPIRWLHSTVQTVGYADETPRGALDAVITAVRDRLATVPAYEVEFGRPLVFSEAVVLRAEPAAPAQQVQAAIRAAIADALGPDAVGPDAVGAPAPHWAPHVSVAYSSADADAAPYVAAVEAVAGSTATVGITEVTLIRQERRLAPEWCYRWTVVDSAPLA